eukprot:5828514-Prymnesium_polylepis.1
MRRAGQLLCDCRAIAMWLPHGCHVIAMRRAGQLLDRCQGAAAVPRGGGGRGGRDLRDRAQRRAGGRWR